MKPQVFQRDEKVYIVAPVSGYTPGDQQIEALAFAEALKSEAPNDNIMWLKGAYAEAERANANGHIWQSEEISIKHLTPRLMPVTVMHDPSTAVGLIADAKLLTPEADGVQRSRIDTTLAIWRHRFPEIATECADNYDQGTLMQSMECHPGYYECASCGVTAPNVPGKLYDSGLCEHVTAREGMLRGDRILGNVTFTGTGLIFGSRGAKGAYDEADLQVFQEAVAEFHTGQGNHTKRTSRRTTRMETVEVSKQEYEALVKRPTAEALAEAVERAEIAEKAKTDAEAKIEAAEIAQKSAEDKAETAEKATKDLEEAASATKLADDRIGKVGTALLKKLPDSIKDNLAEQAKSMSDEDWTARLSELAELTGVKPDEKAEEDENEEFSAEEVAAAQVGRESAKDAKEPSRERRAALVGGLMKDD